MPAIVLNPSLIVCVYAYILPRAKRCSCTLWCVQAVFVVKGSRGDNYLISISDEKNTCQCMVSSVWELRSAQLRLLWHEQTDCQDYALIQQDACILATYQVALLTYLP